MSEKYIVVKYYDTLETFEIFSNISDLLAYVVQEKLAGNKICVFKLGECIGDFS